VHRRSSKDQRRSGFTRTFGVLPNVPMRLRKFVPINADLTWKATEVMQITSGQTPRSGNVHRPVTTNRESCPCGAAKHGRLAGISCKAVAIRTNKYKGPPASRRPNWEGVLCQTYWAKALRVGRTPLALGLSSCYDATRDAESCQPP
jgi:hypothetical protein